MVNVIKPKRGDSDPGTDDIADGEIAINKDANPPKLFVRVGTNIRQIGSGESNQTLTTGNGISGANSGSDGNFTIAVEAAQTTVTSMFATDLKIGEDDQTKIDFETADEIQVYLNNAKDFTFSANTFTALSGSSIVVPAGGLTIGSTAVSSTAAELNYLDDDDLTAADLTKLAAVTSTAAELNILDGVTATATELNLVDGGTSRGTTAVASGDGFLHNDGGVMRMTNVSKLADRLAGSGLSNSDGVLAVGTLNQNTTGSAATLTTARTIGGVSFNGSANITVSSATGAFTAAGILKTDDTTEATSTTDGSLQTDGGLSVAKSAVIGDDLDLLSNSAIFKIGNAQPFTLTHSNSNNTAMVSSGHRLAFGDNGEFITGDGTNMTIATSGDFRLDCGDDIELDITDGSSTFRIKDNGSVFFRVNPSDGHVDLDADAAEIHFGADEEIQLVHVHDVGLKLTETGGGTPTLQFVDANESVSSDGSNLIVTSGGTAFKIPTSDGSSGHFLKTDGSGNLSFAAVSSGSGDITSVVAGAGMTGGATSGDATVNVIGGDGITANANDVAITAAQTTVTSMLNSSLVIGRDAHNQIDFSTDNQIKFKTNNETPVIIMKASGEIEATKFDGALEGNADTATALATARNIGGVSFDGTGNIDLPGVNSAGNQNTTGSAATLTTARNIGGVSFNGSANINLPGVNTSGDQDTSGNAATATALTSGNKTIAGVLDITDDTDSSDDSGDTGALRVEGGASIAKKLFVGTDLDVDGTTNLDVVDIDGAVDMATTLTLAGNADFNGDLDVDGTTNLDVVDIDGAVDMASTLAMADHITMATDKKIIFRATDIFMHSNSANDLKITTPADLLISANGIITYDSDQHDFGESTSSDVVFNFNTSGNDGRLTWDQSADTFVFDKAVDVPASGLKIDGTAVSSTAAELNIMDGVTASTSELNIMDGVTATTSELNALDGITATVGELNLLDGNTSVGSSITVGDNDGIIMNDGGTMKSVPASAVKTYAGGGASTGNYSFSANTMSNSNAMTIDCGNDINLDADGGDIVLKDDGTTYGSLTNNSGGLIVKSGTTSVMMYDSSGSPAINNNAIKQIGAWIFGHSNLDNNQGTKISWSSSNSNQGDVFNHRALMPAKGKIVKWIMKTDGGISGIGTPPMTVTLAGSSTSGQSDALHSDDAGRFTGAVSSAEDLTGLVGYEWEAGDTITGVINCTAGSNQRAQSSALIEWTY